MTIQEIKKEKPTDTIEVDGITYDENEVRAMIAERANKAYLLDIDFEALKKQKVSLAYSIEMDERSDDRYSSSRAEDLTAILHIIDAIQDQEVDRHEVDEKAVFTLEDEPTPTEKVEVKESDVWEFVEKHYPNYGGCNVVGDNNALEVLFFEEKIEEGSYAEKILKEDYNSDTSSDKFLLDYWQNNHECYKKAIEGWIEYHPNLDGDESTDTFVKVFIPDYHGNEIVDQSLEASTIVEKAEEPTKKQLIEHYKLETKCFQLAIRHYQLQKSN